MRPCCACLRGRNPAGDTYPKELTIEGMAATKEEYSKKLGSLQAEADPAALESSKAYLAKLRDTVLAQAGVNAANVKLVPLPSNTATCEHTGCRVLAE